jgi:hypothetical protein
MGYPCPWCHNIFDRESAWLTHLSTNRACSIAAALSQGRGGRRHTAAADDDWQPQDDPPPDPGNDPPDDPGNDPEEEDDGGAGEGDAGQHDEEQPLGGNDDDDEELEDFETPQERVDRMIVSALLSAGHFHEPLTDRGKMTILDLIHDPAFDASVSTIRTVADVDRYLQQLWVDSDRGWLAPVAIATRQCDPVQWKKDLSIYVADGLASAIDMVQSKEAVKHLTWEWDGPEGEYLGPLSGNRARARRQMVKAAFGEHVIYVPLVWFSDKTHLDVKGRHSCHPGFIKLAGWDDTMQFHRRGSRIVVLLPTLPHVPFNKATKEIATAFRSKTAWAAYLKMRRFDIHQQAIAMALATLHEASHRYKIHTCTHHCQQHHGGFRVPGI